MNTISKAQLLDFQAKTFRFAPGLRITKPEQAVEYVNERGFIFFWPVKGYSFPNLWGAVAGDRPVADEHDDPGHVTWNWKDSLIDKKVWYYARVLKHKNTFISLDAVKYFYALSPNYGEPEIDLMDQYNQGLLPLEVKLIFEALSKNGPLDTLSLRKEAHLAGAGSQSPFNRALDILQGQLRVMPVAVSEAGAWKYAFVYDLTHRYLPEIPESARYITENQAMDHLLRLFFKSLGAANLKQVTGLFKWEASLTRRSLDRLVATGYLAENVKVEGKNEAFYCLTELTASS
jgi:hypothetical protein